MLESLKNFWKCVVCYEHEFERVNDDPPVETCKVCGLTQAYLPIVDPITHMWFPLEHLEIEQLDEE